MTKKNIMPVAVLTVICIVVAILLAVVNYFAAPEIAKNAERSPRHKRNIHIDTQGKNFNLRIPIHINPFIGSAHFKNSSFLYLCADNDK